MADASVTGAVSYIEFDWEGATTYGTAATGTFKAFGVEQSFTYDATMNSRRVYGLGAFDAVKNVSGIFAGRLTVDFTLASTYFMKAVMGRASDTAGAPDTHSYLDNANKTVTSMTINTGNNLDVDSVFQHLGCVVDRCTLRGAVGEPGRVGLDILYGNETKSTSGLIASPAVDTHEPLIFAHGSLDIPSGTTIARVQSFELEIGRNARLLYGLGDRTAAAAVWLAREWNWTATVTYENAAFIEDMYGATGGPLTATEPAGEASLVLTFSNGASGDNLRSLVITLTTTFVSAVSKPERIEDLTIQEVTGHCLGLTTIVGSDATAVTP